MFDENQLVEIKWNVKSKKHYIDLGYNFTKINDTFQVKAKDLTHSATAIITEFCDYCGKEINRKYYIHFKSTKNNTVKCACESCKKYKNNEYYFADKRKHQLQKFIMKCNENGWEPITTESDCIELTRDMRFYYNCSIHGENSCSLNAIEKGEWGCQGCARILQNKQSQSLLNKYKGNGFKLSTDEVIKRVNSKHNSILLNPEDYVNKNTRNLRVKCGLCGEIYTTYLDHFKKDCFGACNNCSNNSTGNHRRLPIEKVKFQIESINENIWLNPEDYKTGHDNNLKILCGCCKKNIFVTSLNNYCGGHKKNRCDECTNNISKGEKNIADFLTLNSIMYYPQYSFKDCIYIRVLRFDFYLPNYNLCIEFQGQQHYDPIKGWGDKEQLELNQKRDTIKRNYCKNNNIKLLEIPYWDIDNIDNILKENLLI